MARWYGKWMHPHTDEATWNAYQDAAAKLHYRRSPTDQDRAIVALYDALEVKASQLKSLALKVALASEEPSVKAMSKHSALSRSSCKQAA